MVFIQMLAGFPQGLVQRAQWRAPVAADETCGVQTGGLVAQPLHQGQAHQRLNAGEVDTAVKPGVFVVQRGLSTGEPVGMGGCSGRLRCVLHQNTPMVDRGWRFALACPVRPTRTLRTVPR